MKNIVERFQKLSQIVKILQKDLDISYMDALIETIDNINSGEIHVEEGLPHKEVRRELEKKYAEANFNGLSNEEKRKVFQYLILQAYKKEMFQANHLMTPDTVAIFMYSILDKVLLRKKENTLLDITVGTGNLLCFVMDKLQKSGTKVQAFGIDNDDSLIALAGLNVELEKLQVELFHQDALDGLVIPQVDTVISDLPVGYYPIDEKVKEFKTRAATGHSYVHHLLIEQAINQLKDGGIGIFLVPQNLFETEESKKLLEYIQSDAYLQGMLGIPLELFKNKKDQKSILILQKKGGSAKQADQILLGNFPSIFDEKALEKFRDELDSWSERNFRKQN